MSNNNSDPANEDVVAEIKDDSALLASALGGWAGVIDSGLPFVVFTIAYLVTDRNLETTLYAALGTAAVLALLRLVRRQSLQQVFSGLIGIAIAPIMTGSRQVRQLVQNSTTLHI